MHYFPSLFAHLFIYEQTHDNTKTYTHIQQSRDFEMQRQMVSIAIWNAKLQLIIWFPSRTSPHSTTLLPSTSQKRQRKKEQEIVKFTTHSRFCGNDWSSVSLARHRMHSVARQPRCKKGTCMRIFWTNERGWSRSACNSIRISIKATHFVRVNKIGLMHFVERMHFVITQSWS